MAVRLFAWGPAATWAAVLFLLSASPDLPVSGWARAIPDEVLHLVAYTVLGATLAHARFHGARGVAHVAMIALGALYGAADEWHQSFVPGRVSSLGDWSADVLGVVLGYVLSWTLASALLRRPDTDTKGSTT
jgi:VanZ family protein